MTHRLLSLTLLLSGLAATHAPTEAVVPASVRPVSNAKTTDRDSFSTTTSSVHPADSSSAQSTPALIPVAEPVILEGTQKDVEWYSYFYGIYTFNLTDTVAEIRANWDNLPVRQTINGWKRISESIIWKLGDDTYPIYTINRDSEFLRISRSSYGVPVICLDWHLNNPGHEEKKAAKLLNAPEDYIGHLEYFQEHMLDHKVTDCDDLSGFARCFELAKDYNPETAHTTPTALKLPEMETAPALLRELLQVLKSSSSTPTDKLTRLPSAVAPGKAPLERSPVLR